MLEGAVKNDRRTTVAVLLTIVYLMSVEVVADTSVTDTFTDSFGQTIHYRYWLKDGWDPLMPRGLLIEFHGNVDATEEEVLARHNAPDPVAFENELASVVVVSPFALGGTRFWHHSNGRLIHELLQSNFGGNLTVDFGRVIFSGASDGTGFLHRFLRTYGEHYGGGFWAQCGFFTYADPTWNPVRGFVDGFRVIVQAPTEDFLYGDALKAYGYYKYTLGLETRGDLKASGDHCEPGAIAFRSR